MKLDLDRRIRGTLRRSVIEEFFTNSVHFPMANILVELIMYGAAVYLAKPDPYVLIFACLVQAFAMGWARFLNKGYAFLGNTIGFAIYGTFEIFYEGFSKFNESVNHRVYLGFSMVIGILQYLKQVSPPSLGRVFLLAEHMVRTLIVLAMYWVIENKKKGRLLSVGEFLESDGHLYVALILIMIGFVIGSSNLTANYYLNLLQGTTRELRRYSEWLFGKALLGQVMDDQGLLGLTRRERCVLFMDIRGFTSWAETETPEAVVSLLNAYFELAEPIWERHGAIKVKYTGDEIMVVFEDPKQALESARQVQSLTRHFLAQSGLSAGIGLHKGELIEGLVGSREVKAYDIIGDTVNTAKRLCDAAQGTEILMSEPFCKVAGGTGNSTDRLITAKGKKEPIQVFSLSLHG